jgi:hypothetical protein
LDGLLAGGEDAEPAALMNLEMEVGEAGIAKDTVVPGISANQNAALLEDLGRVG